MTGKQLGLTGIIVTISMAALVLSGIAVLEALSAGLAAAGIEGRAAATTRAAVLSALLALGVISTGIALVAGRALSRALSALRSAVLARARGDTDKPLPTFPVTQLNAIASAVERLSARDAAREAAARRESAELTVLLDTISEGILRIDASGRLVRSNPAARAMLGLATATEGQPVAAHIRNADLRAVLRRGANGESVTAAEIPVDGRRLLVSACPVDALPDGGGAVVAFVDLTEVRRLENVRRDFVANVSHELKTPLTSIRGYAETLLTDDDMPAEMRRHFIEVVQKNAERLHRIVDELLDLSRLESGGWRPHLQAVDARALICDVWTGCSGLASQRRVRFEPPANTFTVRADPAGLRQVLSNLFDNALRYTPEDGCVRVSLHRAEAVAPGAEPTIVFEVRDTGVGIPSDALPRIFERFYRVDPARSRAAGGTGLGLAIVKHLLERMGGEVTAQSELGKGTTMRFRLPESNG